MLLFCFFAMRNVVASHRITGLVRNSPCFCSNSQQFHSTFDQLLDHWFIREHCYLTLYFHYIDASRYRRNLEICGTLRWTEHSFAAGKSEYVWGQKSAGNCLDPQSAWRSGVVPSVTDHCCSLTLTLSTSHVCICAVSCSHFQFSVTHEQLTLKVPPVEQ